MDRQISPYFVIIGALFFFTFIESFLNVFIPSLFHSFFEAGFWLIALILLLPMIMLILYIANMKYELLGDKENIFYYAMLMLMAISITVFQFLLLPLI